METFPKDPFKKVEAWMVNGGKRKVMGSWGRQLLD